MAGYLSGLGLTWSGPPFPQPPAAALGLSAQPTPPSTPRRFKVERYMQVVFGLSAVMLFVPVLYHQTTTKDPAPGAE